MNQIHAQRAIYCIGRNYGAHAKELGNAIPDSPVVFLKSPAAIRSLQDRGLIAYPTETFHHELELVLKIGPAKKANRDFLSNDDVFRLLERIEAVALGIDLTRREVQNRLKKEGLPWTDAKSFKGSAVLTGFHPLPTGMEPGEISKLIDSCRFKLWINNELRQEGSPHEMIFPCQKLLSVLQTSHGLHVGDIIFTGTPHGVGPIRIGDRIRMQLFMKEKPVIDESGEL
jgi:fumarylpyruvate hydrolase